MNPKDFLGLESSLDPVDRQVVDTVRSFVRDRVLPDAGGWYDRAEFPRHLVGEMAKIGLLGMHLEGYGCAGTTATQYGLACLELEAGDSGIRSFVSVQGSLAMFPIHAYGSQEQKNEWLPRMAAGEAIGCFGLTEPDSGSDPASMRTHARRDGTDWILNGSKMWITNGPIADVAVVWAQTTEGVRGFLVPRGVAGFQAHEIRQKMSLRASYTGELVFQDVRLPGDAVLPGVVGMRGPLSCLSEARFGILFGVVGAARACYEAALDYTIGRTQFGRPLAANQLVQRALVELMVRVNRSYLLARHLGALKDAGGLAPALVSYGKMENVRAAIEVAREARGLLGANGISLEYPVIRHMTNLESVYTYEGTHEIHTLVLGQALTGLAAFRG
ncbi:acyl-CoA dehydrogenase family protein [Dactylosporangium sp. CA-139066]|uniref:acyl-CoA dehydrogenase family protein n=1 Tax=Dactylosporangium sp. CA-139066 TaxID=3239930 RepID=UPI003D8B3798